MWQNKAFIFSRAQVTMNEKSTTRCLKSTSNYSSYLTFMQKEVCGDHAPSFFFFAKPSVS